MNRFEHYVDPELLFGLYGNNPVGEMLSVEVGAHGMQVYLYLLSFFSEGENVHFDSSESSVEGIVYLRIPLPDILTNLDCTFDQLEHWLGALVGSNIVSGWEVSQDESEDFGFLEVDIGIHGPGWLSLDIEQLDIWEEPTQSFDVKRDKVEDDGWGNRMEEFEDQKEKTLSQTNQSIQNRIDKIKSRGQDKPSSPEEFEEGYKNNKIGLIHCYADIYYGIVGTSPPSLYTETGKPGKRAYKLFSIVDNWGIDVAFDYLDWIAGNWDLVTEHTHIEGPPKVSSVVYMSNDLCPYIKAGKSPVKGIGIDESKKGMAEYDGTEEESSKDDFFNSLPDGVG